MSNLVSPYPPRDYDPEFLPKSQWWRLRMLPMALPDHYMYVVTLHPEQGKDDVGDNCEFAAAIEWEWFDGYDTILDAGLDVPNVAAMMITYIAPEFEYLDLLTDHQPTPCHRWQRITKVGQRDHPDYGPFADVGDPDGPDSTIEDTVTACEILQHMNFGNPSREVGRWP